MIRRSSAGALLALVVSVPLAAQAPDTTRKDTTAVELPPIEVVGSILAPTGPKIGSGVPARTTILTREEIEASEPRLLTDVLVTQA
jgi:hypothetical protein